MMLRGAILFLNLNPRGRAVAALSGQKTD